MADEKHTRWLKQRIYLAVTAAKGCLFGNHLSLSAGNEGLKAAYGVFQQEAHDLDPDYRPKTVTTDGWDATCWAWEQLYSGIVWILCFLHEVIKVRDGCRSKPDLCDDLLEDLWHIYHAKTKRHFAQRLRRVPGMDDAARPASGGQTTAPGATKQVATASAGL